MHQERPRLHGNKLAAYNHITKSESRILVIGDLHCPFDLDEYFDFCKETLAGFKVPKKVIFCELPKTSTGKIQKFELRKQF